MLKSYIVIVTSLGVILPLLSTHLVGVVRVDEVESAGRRAAEGSGSPGVRLLGVRGLRRSVGVRQLVE